MKVLLVDDDRELCQLLKEYMESHNFEVSMMHDGEEIMAVEAIESHYELMILDIMMPRMSGLEVLPLIRARSTIPIIMVTGRGDDIDRILGLEMGADDYIPKPCNPRELVARINAVMRRFRSGRDRLSSHETARALRIDIQGLSVDGAAREATLNDQPLGARKK